MGLLHVVRARHDGHNNPRLGMLIHTTFILAPRCSADGQGAQELHDEGGGHVERDVVRSSADSGQAGMLKGAHVGSLARPSWSNTKLDPWRHLAQEDEEAAGLFKERVKAIFTSIPPHSVLASLWPLLV